MKKEEFLQKLREKLSILEESEIDDIINEYSEHINEKLKTKKKEEKIIEEFGSVDELASDILKAYKINENYNEKNEFNETAKKYFNKFESIINKIVKKFTTSTFSEIIKFVIELFIICILIALVKVPFAFVENVINDLFINWVRPLNQIFPTIFTFVIEVLYLLVAFFMFITIFKERYLSDEDIDEEINRKEELKKNKALKEEKIIKNKTKKTSAFQSLSDFIFIIVKILLVFMTLPFVFTFILSVSGLVLSIIFSIEYFSIIGITILIIGIILGHIWLITILYNFILNKASNGKYLFIIFIISLILIGIGFASTVLQISKIDYRNISELNLEYNTKEYNFDLNTILNENNKEFDISTFNDDNVKIMIDNTLNNNIKIEVSYIDNLMKLKTYKGDYYADFHIYYDVSARKGLNFILDNLKENKIYDLTTANMQINIYVSENNLNKIKING